MTAVIDTNEHLESLLFLCAQQQRASLECIVQVHDIGLLYMLTNEAHDIQAKHVQHLGFWSWRTLLITVRDLDCLM